MVTLDQVVEHLSDAVSVLQGIHRVLKPGGQLIVSTPNASGWGAHVFGRRWIHWHAPYHQQFFSRRSMTRTADLTGFEIRQSRTVTNTAWLDYQWGHLVTCPSPGQPSPFWAADRRRTLPQRVALRLFRWMDQLGINAVLTRLFDALRLGDNVVYVLSRRPE